MELIELIKQFSHKQYLVVSHYPRGHLTLAGALCGLVLVLLVLPLGGDEDEANGRTEIALDIDLSPELEKNADTEQEQPDALALSDFVITSHAKSQIEVQLILEDVTLWRNIEVKSGDNLSAIFSKVGLSDQDLFRVLNSSDEAKVLNQVYPGYQLDFLIPVNVDGDGELEQLRLLKSPLEGFLFTLNNNNYDVESILNFPQLRPTFKAGTIADSLFMAGQREQIPAVTIMEMANIFGGVIDFILDPRAGDDFSILYDEKYLDGEFIGHGDILATQYTNQGKTFTAVRYIDEEGEAGYYNAEGESMRKAFLRSPIDVFRISSNFNPSRRHPILNTIRAHKGTDYAAPRGTPIRATSDGQVTRASRNGSFGNLVIVKHAGGFETKYAHLSKYANGVKKGKRVRQGDIIGYVGTTGSATGPHLHYEFLMGGVHQNPRTIIDKLPKAKSIDPAEMDSFHTQTVDLLKRFSDMNSTTFITLNQPSAD
jgi:murein DD-endopeptidase MepM/ murein hydrolase activator NlpD|tara:strand:+ start:214 stop:1662 length:1449 start_codon:yes stop_codon:yes gene_type:complete